MDWTTWRLLSYSATSFILYLIVWSWVTVFGSTRGRCPASASALAVMLSPECSKSLFLGVRIDVSADHEADDVEEWNPCLLWQEFLRECEADGGRDPADLHDGPEAGLDCCSNLVESPGPSNDGHEDEIDRVLDRCNLWARISCMSIGALRECQNSPRGCLSKFARS